MLKRSNQKLVALVGSNSKQVIWAKATKNWLLKRDNQKPVMLKRGN
jgi:hypothetical protein